jgi:hypothetical protein
MAQQNAIHPSTVTILELSGGALMFATTGLVAAAALTSGGDAEAARLIVPGMQWIVLGISGSAIAAFVLRALVGKSTASIPAQAVAA